MGDHVRLKFNGQEIEVEKGTFLIEAAKKASVEIPHFCYHPKLKYDANCRMCIVEVEKVAKLQTSCSTLAAEGMVVWSNTPRVKAAQEGVMAYLLGNHPLDCPECDQGGECQLQDFAHKNSPTSGQFVEAKRVFAKEYFGPLIEKEMNRCVSCLRCVRYCDEVLDVNALGSIDRGSATQIGGFAHHALDCEFCGGCIQICPVGALTSRLSMYTYRPWQVKKTETICSYCGDGCQLTLETIDQQVIRVSSEMGTGRNEGDLCARGHFGYGFINSPERLTRPILRHPTNGKFQVTWEMAINKAASGLAAVKSKYGAQAIAGLISARVTNEEVYLFQKLMRQGIGTPHIDSSARYGHINAVSALHRAFGTTRLARYEGVVCADVVLVFAGDMTETNPIAAIKVKEAVRRFGAKLICVDSYGDQSDPYRSHLPRLAAHHLQIKPATEGVAIAGLLKAVSELPSLKDSVAAFSEKIKVALSGISFSQIESATGVSELAYRKVAALYAGAERGMLILGRAITGGQNGHANVMALSDLAILAGQVGKAGSGILSLTEENNEQGAVEMGGVPEFLPGLKSSAARGNTLLEMIDAAQAGEIKALYLVGENPLRSLPQKEVRAALSKLDLLICQDLFDSETAELAHVILPSCSFAEKDGTFTNEEGMVLTVRKAIDPIGSTKPDWQIFAAIAEKMGLSGFHYKNAGEIYREIASSMPVGWPERPADLQEKMASYMESCQPSYAEFPVLPAHDEGGFDLRVGQLLFHSGRMSTHAPGLQMLSSKESLMIHPDDAERLGVKDGDQVSVSANGSGSAGPIEVRLSKKLLPGGLFLPEHFGLEVKGLLPLFVDPTTHVPYGNQGRVHLTKVEPTQVG